MTADTSASFTVGGRFRRWYYVYRAFLRIGILDAVSYPFSFVAARVSLLMPIVIFAVIADFLSPDGDGTAYFSYVVLGLAVAEVLDAGLRGMGERLGSEISTGRLEMYLTEPVPTTFLPFGLVQFELVARSGTAALVVITSLLMGADYVWGWGILGAIGMLALGLFATLAIAVTGAAVKILAKRADPLLMIYGLGSRVFGGVFFPVDQLPEALEPLAWLFPHTYVIEVTRDLVLPQEIDGVVDSIPVAVLALIVMILVLLPLGLLAFTRAVDYGKRRGLLSGY